jgi:hypothetical protein
MKEFKNYSELENAANEYCNEVFGCDASFNVENLGDGVYEFHPVDDPATEDTYIGKVI